MKIRLLELRNILKEAIINEDENEALPRKNRNFAEKGVFPSKIHNFIEKEVFRYLEYYAHMTALGTDYDFKTIVERSYKFVLGSLKSNKEMIEHLSTISKKDIFSIVRKVVIHYFRRFGIKHIPIE